MVTIDVNCFQIQGNSDLQSLTSIFTEESESTGNDEKRAKWKKTHAYKFSARVQILINFNKPQNHHILATELIKKCPCG